MVVATLPPSQPDRGQPDRSQPDRGQDGPGCLGTRLSRFDPVERWVHWLSAGLFLILLATGAILNIGSLAILVGRRDLVRQIHVYAGLVLIVPVLIALAGKWGKGLRADLARLNRWHNEDRRWLRCWGRDPMLAPGKFNAGQKLNTAFTGGAAIVMLATGVIMRWFSPFPLAWRTGATFVHDLIATALLITIAGHVLYALGDRGAMRAMIRGWVEPGWARSHAPRWYAELTRHDELAGGDELTRQDELAGQDKI